MIFGGKNEYNTIEEREILTLKFGRYVEENSNEGKKQPLYPLDFEADKSSEDFLEINKTVMTRSALKSSNEKQEPKECLKEKIVDELGKVLHNDNNTSQRSELFILESKQLSRNEEMLQMASNPEITFMTNDEHAQDMEIDSKATKYIFTICPMKGEIQNKMQVVTEMVDSDQEGDQEDSQETPPKESINPEVEETDNAKEESYIVVKNTDSKLDSEYIVDTLLKLSKMHEKEGAADGEYQISAYKVTPNDPTEKPVYDKSSDEVSQLLLIIIKSDVESCGIKRHRNDDDNQKSAQKRLKLSDNDKEEEDDV